MKLKQCLFIIPAICLAGEMLGSKENGRQNGELFCVRKLHQMQLQTFSNRCPFQDLSIPGYTGAVAGLVIDDIDYSGIPVATQILYQLIFGFDNNLPGNTSKSFIEKWISFIRGQRYSLEFSEKQKGGDICESMVKSLEFIKQVLDEGKNLPDIPESDLHSHGIVQNYKFSKSNVQFLDLDKIQSILLHPLPSGVTVLEQLTQFYTLKGRSFDSSFETRLETLKAEITDGVTDVGTQTISLTIEESQSFEFHQDPSFSENIRSMCNLI